MFKRKTLFRSDLWVKENVGTASQRLDTIQEIYKAKEKNPVGDHLSNINCWRQMYCCNDISWIVNEIGDMIDDAVNFYKIEDDFYRSIEFTKDLEISYWANVNSYNSRNVFHAHKPVHFSAVYYLQGTDTGGIRFVNPGNILNDCNTNAPFVRDFVFLPTDGDLILFPSWLPHEVDVNLSDRDRINLVFDIKLKIK